MTITNTPELCLRQFSGFSEGKEKFNTAWHLTEVNIRVWGDQVARISGAA